MSCESSWAPHSKHGFGACFAPAGGAGAERGGLQPNAPCALPTNRDPGGAGGGSWPAVRGTRGCHTTLETSPEGQARWGPHSPFSRVCRFARTRRKVCRGETRASGRGCKQLSPRPYTRPGPVPPLPAHPRDNAPSAGLPPLQHPPLPGPRRRAPSCRSA